MKSMIALSIGDSLKDGLFFLKIALKLIMSILIHIILNKKPLSIFAAYY